MGGNCGSSRSGVGPTSEVRCSRRLVGCSGCESKLRVCLCVWAALHAVPHTLGTWPPTMPGLSVVRQRAFL